MIVDLTSEQRNLLLQLVDQAIREIGPEIRHTMTSTYKDDLKQQRRDLFQLQAVLTARPEADVDAPTSGMFGTP